MSNGVDDTKTAWIDFYLHFLSLDEIFPHQDRQVRDYVIHPEYYKGGLFNDIALLFLSSPVDIVENVNTVCLPNQGDIFDGARCFASGWGKDLFGKEGKYQVSGPHAFKHIQKTTDLI